MNPSNGMSINDLKKLKSTLFSRILLFFICFGLLVLLPAGTLWYWQFYLYLLTIFCPMLLVLFYFMRKNPEFLVKRMNLKESQIQQKNVIRISSIAYIAGFIIPGLDYRFGWSNVPTWAIICANGAVILGYMLIIWVFKVNNYASRVIEIQENQKVISNGPYRLIRHPMYLGTLIMYFATPIALGSYWGIIPFLLLPYTLSMRIQGEESMLTNELEGYVLYCEKVRYRLLPFIW